MIFCPSCRNVTLLQIGDIYACQRCVRRYKDGELLEFKEKPDRMVRRATMVPSKVDMETGEILEYKPEYWNYTEEQLKHYRLQDMKRKEKKYKVGSEWV